MWMKAVFCGLCISLMWDDKNSFNEVKYEHNINISLKYHAKSHIRGEMLNKCL